MQVLKADFVRREEEVIKHLKMGGLVEILGDDGKTVVAQMKSASDGSTDVTWDALALPPLASGPAN
jgi:aminopeptidase-like protein